MNLRPAPFHLTESTVRAVLGDRPGARVVHVPVLPVKLVDRPRPSEAKDTSRERNNGR